MSDRHKKPSNYALAQELERLLTVVPMVEEHRDIIKDAIERLKYLED